MMKKEAKITRKNVKEHIDCLISKQKYNEVLELIRRFRVKGYSITQSKAKSFYKLSNEQLSKLNFIEIKNPHYSCAAAMKLFLIAQIDNVYNQIIY